MEEEGGQPIIVAFPKEKASLKKLTAIFIIYIMFRLMLMD